MRSSSQLFPVALHSAEIHSPYMEDVYLLKPGNSDDPSTQLAVTHLFSGDRTAARGHVVLLHGAFANRRFWYPDWETGFALFLARVGFDVWMPEMRGHGLSPQAKSLTKTTLHDYVHCDLPAVARFIAEQAGCPVVWLGHSLGGLLIANALHEGSLGDEVSAYALINCQTEFLHGMMRAPGSLSMLRRWLRRKVMIVGERYGLGVENEPGGLLAETTYWFSRLGRRKKNAPLPFGLIAKPGLFVGSSCDPLDKDGESLRFAQLLAGEQATYHCWQGSVDDTKGYDGHFALFRDADAVRGIWREITQWLALAHGALNESRENAQVPVSASDHVP